MHEHERLPAAPAEERATGGQVGGTSQAATFSGGHGIRWILGLQQAAGNRATSAVLQRAPTATGDTLDKLKNFFVPPPMPAPKQKARPEPDPPPTTRLRSSLGIRIVAHASPRWKSAKGPTDADKRNERLSRQRAQTVKGIVDAALRSALGSNADIRYEVEYAPGDEREGLTTLGSEAVGSRETLVEAKGDRTANADNQRRVDVFVDRIDRRQEHAGRSGAPTTKTSLTDRWRILPGLSAGGAVFGGYGGISVRLINADTGHEGFAHIRGWTGGTQAGIGAAASVGGDPVSFFTDRPMGFKDFEGQPVTFSSIGVGLVFVGWERARLGFDNLGSAAQELDVGGWNVGAKLEAGITRLEGTFHFDNVAPSDEYTVPSQTEFVPFTSSERHGDLHTAFFETGASKLAPADVKTLETFVLQAAGRLLESE